MSQYADCVSALADNLTGEPSDKLVIIACASMASACGWDDSDIHNMLSDTKARTVLSHEYINEVILQFPN
jgi:hypothetical protein